MSTLFKRSIYILCICYFLGENYNPCGRNHTDNPKAEDRQVGDIGKLTIPSTYTSEEDVLEFTQTDTQVKLSGPLSVIGRSVVIQGGSKSTKIACATIGITEWEGRQHPDMDYSVSNSFWIE